jgi:hypothetical protein
VNTYLHSLRFALSGQASAYGFTLIIWGTGALAVYQLGQPDPAEVFSYVGGALVAAVLIIAVAFGVRNILREDEPRRRAYSAMHLPSVPIAMLAGWAVTHVLVGWAGFFMAGFVAVLLYELLLSVEIVLGLVSSAR